MKLTKECSLVALTALVLVWYVPPAGAATPLSTKLVASGLTRPVFVAAPPQDFDRLFIVEKRGVIKVLNLFSGTVNVTPFLDIDALVGGGLTDNSEQGLLGLAFHPAYDSNGLFYVNYTDNSGNSVVARYHVSADPDIADPGSVVTVITYNQPQANHNGGWLGFGPEGYLYIATGDGGGAGDDDAGHTPGVGNGQDITDNLLGKILRIDVDADDFPTEPNRNYAIPPDNPFVGVTGDDEIWVFGLRNPWRPSIDRVTGERYIADVGQGTWEEVDYQAADSPGGENYGWRCREGAHDFNTSGDCSQTPFVDPIYEYSHGGSPFRCSITGGYVYRGCAIPDLRGTYFFADWCSAQIWSFRFVGGLVTDFQDRTAELDPPGATTISSIASFGEDAVGELYIIEQDSSGAVFRVIPAGALEFPPNHDYDNDGDVDRFDLMNFGACLSGPDIAFGNCLCDVFDEDGDGDLDMSDFAGFSLSFSP